MYIHTSLAICLHGYIRNVFANNESLLRDIFNSISILTKSCQSTRRAIPHSRRGMYSTQSYQAAEASPISTS